MSTINNRLFCRLNGMKPVVREQQRVNTLKRLGLLETETIPVFDEATQTAASFLETPICILGLMVHDNLWLKAAFGLSRLGLMNKLASSRQIPRQEALSTYVVDSEQSLIINDTLADSTFANSLLAQQYRIRAFLGTPLITAEGQCIGTLAVMDLVPREFSQKDVEFLTLTARWCLREFERDYLLKHQVLTAQEESTIIGQKISGYSPNIACNGSHPSTSPDQFSHTINKIKLQFLHKMLEELHTPLTSVVGMSKVLQGKMFGSLSGKQKEYIDIIHASGKQMTSLVQQSLKLGAASENTPELELNPVNIEMLAQQVLKSLKDIAQQKGQTLELSVEPGSLIWLLDKEKVQQSIYYLVISILHSSEAGEEIRIHISRPSHTINISVWLANTLLAHNLPPVDPDFSSNNHRLNQLQSFPSLSLEQTPHSHLDDYILTAVSLETMINGQEIHDITQNNSQELWGLLLACHLAESHGGNIMVKRSSGSGYRYVLMFPKISGKDKLIG